MADALAEWQQSITLRKIEINTVDFKQVKVVTDTFIFAVVQPTNAEAITVAQVDWSLKHYTVHTLSKLDMSSIIIYQDKEYKAIQVTAWGDYGYYEAVFEEVK